MRIVASLIAALTLVAADMATPKAATDPLDTLLEQVRAGRVRDSEENAARIRDFEAARDRRRQLLREAEEEQRGEEERAARLERQFEDNEVRIIEQEDALRERLGALQELYGVLQQVAGDASAQFTGSLTNVQFAGRARFLDEFARRMGRKTRPPSIAEMERLWFELQREMIESGRVVRLSIPVIEATGGIAQREAVRIGPFNLVAGGEYLEYVPETGRVVQPPRQPGRRFLALAAELEAADAGWRPFALDPSRGRLLSLLIQKPGWREQVEQGGVIGYLVLALGALALLIALERLLSLAVAGARVSMQIRRPHAPGNNPLGRVLQVYHANPGADLETLELRLAEAILKETARLQKRLAFLKIIAVVAPLMGLLGTVTGMIITFQAIALFGTGDPKLMAGGISQALVTTVMGLCVAIPIVLLHTLASGLARRLVQRLEEQATGMVAAQNERTRTAAAGELAGEAAGQP